MWRYIFWGKRTPTLLVYGVGAYTVGGFFVDFLKAPIMHNTMDPVPIVSRYGRGTTAVITGATSPTGQAFADKLSSQGFKLVLVDDESKASSLSAIADKYASAATVTFDFKRKTAWQEYEALCKQI